MFTNFLARFLPDQLPVLKTMPDHVRDAPLNFGLLAIQMDIAHLPNPAVTSKQATLTPVKTQQ